MKNHTMITEIFLLGFQNLNSCKVPFIFLLTMIYCLTVIGNVLIIALISASKNLNFPMYFFLRQLSISDILLATDIVPNMVNIEMKEGASMSLAGCFTQFYLFVGLEVLECFLLTVMSYDRYLAICSPLHYSSIMDQTFCIKLVGVCWMSGLATIMSSVVNMSTLHFCKHNVVNHFFCDFGPLVELSCSDTFPLQIVDFVFGGTVTVSPFLIIIASYVHIGFTIEKIKSNTGRQKALATCSSHLAVVSIFYGTLIGIYLVPTNGKSMTLSKSLSLLYTVVTPLLNPIIYSMRNKDIKGALIKYIRKYVSKEPI